MKNITDSSLYFSVITDESLIQSYSLDACQANPAQDLLYTSSSVYVIHQADGRVIEDILQAERVGDNLVITSRDASKWNGSLNIEQFFSGNGQLYLARPEADVVRIIAAQDYPQQGSVAFEAQPVDAVAELPQPQTVSMLSNTMFSADPAPAIAEPQPTAPMVMMAALTVSEAPKITNAIDQLGTRTGSLASGSVTDDKLAVLQGSASAGAILNVLNSGVVIGQVQADAQGNWSFMPEERLAESGHVFTVVDTASGEASDGFVLIVDSVAPSRAIIDSVINDQAGGVLVGTNQHTSDNTPVISGRGEAFSMIAIYNGKTLIGTSFADASGTWTFSSPFTFPDGHYTLTAKAIDFSGNTGLASSAYKITIDTIPPAVPVILQADDNVGALQGALTSGDLSDDRTPTLSGQAEAGVTIFVYDGEHLLGTTAADAQGNWSFTPPMVLSDGEHHFTATARDQAGNLSTKSDVFTLSLGEDRAITPTIDNITDNVGSLQGVLLSGASSDDATPGLHGKAQAGDTVNIFDNGVLIGETVADAQGNWYFTPDTNLTEGTHSFQVQAVNNTHSPSLLSPTFDFTLNVTPPDASNLRITGIYDDVGQVTGNVVSGGRTDDRNPTLTGTGPAGETVVIFVKDGNTSREIGRTQADSNGSWVLDVSHELNYGMNTFTAIAVDVAGNATLPSQGYTISVTTSGHDVAGGFDINGVQSSSVTINNVTKGDQMTPQVTKLADGNLVVVWAQSVDSGSLPYMGIAMQIMDPTGTQKIGPQQIVSQPNYSIFSTASNPSVTALADGGFIVAWDSNEVKSNGGIGIAARQYSADGNPLTDVFLASQNTNGTQNSVSGLGLPDGGYILSWLDHSTSKLTQRIYDADSNPVSNDFTLWSPAFQNPSIPRMELLDNDWYLTVSRGVFNDKIGIVAQARKLDGSEVGPVVMLNTYQGGYAEGYPDLLVLKDGSIVSLWQHGSIPTSICAVQYSFDPLTGTLDRAGKDFLVSNKADDYAKPVGVALDDGGYMLFWTEAGSGVLAQRYDANSYPLGNKFIVNLSVTGNQGQAGAFDILNTLDAVLLDDGRVFVTWNSDSADRDGLGIEGTTIHPDAGFYAEFQINTSTKSHQQASSSSALPDGGFVVVWQSNHTGNNDVIAQLFDADGLKVGGEFRVNNTVTDGEQTKPSIITLSDGTLVISYQSSNGGTEVIYTQHLGYTYDESGKINGTVELSGGPVTKTNTYSTYAHLTPLDDGGYMMVWQSKAGTGQQPWTVNSAQFDASGNKVPGSEQNISTMGFPSTSVIGASPETAVVALDNGKVAVVYTRDTTTGDIYFRLYDPATQGFSTEIRANLATTGYQCMPGITQLSNGNLAISWLEGKAVRARIFTPDGEPVTGDFTANIHSVSDIKDSVILSRPEGGFVVLYSANTDMMVNGVSSLGIYAQFFNDNGQRVGVETQIHQWTAGSQYQVNGNFLEDGRLFVSWSDNIQGNSMGDGNGAAVKGRIIDVDTSFGDAYASYDTGREISQIAEGTYGSLWMLFDDGSESGVLLSSESLTAVRGGVGDDVIGITSTAFTSISGGDGIDTLLLDGKNMSLDLDALIDCITGIEKIDLGQGNSNSLSLSANALEGLGQQDMVLADGKNQLVINGDGSNSLQLVDNQAESWSEAGQAEIGGVMYHTWVSGSTEVLVEQNIHVTVM
ncbi:TPA: Ig-like domain-containing protein [Enterobacter cloacae]